jgi:hypothetical protein
MAKKLTQAEGSGIAAVMQRLPSQSREQQSTTSEKMSKPKKAECLVNVIVCKHIFAGALIWHLVPPEDDDEGIGEATCESCANGQSENPDDYAWACWDCVRKKIQ